MNALQRDVEVLLDTIDRLRAQHRAGIQPPFGELDDLFESATVVRSSLTAACANGLTAPPVSRSTGRVTLERLTDGAPVRMLIPVGAAARAVLDALSSTTQGATR